MISMYSEHAENTATATTCLPQLLQQEDFSFQEPSLSDSDLPYIDPSIVSLVYQQWRSSSDATGKHLQVWIVIDNVVYDCTQFQREHPGGIDVIQSFVGQDCSWQFWRFHGQEHMRDYGRPLRIGRTSGIQNRFQERPRYVGLSTLGEDW
ncbi:cytochrome b5-like heme/steroid binding domain-containing protein [Aspergillus caelatus]|uniref:Cytochrome b5-like heme/steroid binding domain-containing protein n=1 Tax=Aspergillus caelatus TaxID=61420 RepID=A0A5N7AHB0_9EURO|nr:cytochrome b5-like heme/steroid binding domain-containing protein [Aspergillus caelatus]KAE8369242.1 cytochrome b5-like heme/steroid binding domain-containing protein [Aspergillus caelatus]